MDDLEAAGVYFERKAAQWTSTEGSVSGHLRRVGKKGLVAELRSDPGFDDVRRYLHRMSDVQYVHDTGYSELTTKVQESVFGSPSSVREVHRQVDQIVRAAMLACGVAPFGERLVRIAGALPRGSPPP